MNERVSLVMTRFQRSLIIVAGIALCALGVCGIAAVVGGIIYTFSSIGIIAGLLGVYIGLGFVIPFFSSLIPLGISLVVSGRAQC